MRIGDPNVQALQAIQTAMQASANNVANVNTEGFKAQSVTLETGPGGYGVRVGDVVASTAPGPSVPAPDAGSGGEPPGPVRDFVQGSNTDLTREMVNQTVFQQAYAANATVVRTTDAMQGVLLDMRA